MMQGHEVYGLSELYRFASKSPWYDAAPKVRTEQVTRIDQRRYLAAFQVGKS